VTGATRLSALIVNHDSGAWALRCVESLQEAWRREGRDPELLEVIVVDSGSNPAEATWWRSLRRAGARVREAPGNVGYATGLNLAYEQSHGVHNDVVALLNPDLHFLPGSIGPLLARLEDPAVGAVAPRIFLDEERQLRLPQNLLPTPGRELGELFASRFRRLVRPWGRSRTARSHDFWTAREPHQAEMLSGACMFLRRGVVEELGGPMDARYPLYFEDADLCVRLTRSRYRLETEPAAEVLHHWSRSAGPVFEGEVARRHALGRALFQGTHHRGPLDRCLRWLAPRIQGWLERRAPRAPHEVEELGSLVESPELEFQGPGPHLLELSLTPWWGLAAGVLVEGQHYHLPARTWSWLFPGTYYLRALEPESGALLGAWSFEKHGPARSWPLEVVGLGDLAPRVSVPRAGERVG